MKRFIFVCSIFTLSFGSISAQQVIATAGSSQSVGELTIDWTLGETICGTGINGNSIITQGFQQGNLLQVKTIEIKVPAYRIKCFPNPTAGFLNISSTNKSIEKAMIRVTSMAGKIVLNAQFNSETQIIDLSPLACGLYLVSVVDSKNRVLANIRVEKR